MFVVKRNGEREPVMFEKVVERIRKLSEELTVCPEVIAQRVLTEIYDGVPTRDLDTLATLTCVSYSTENPDYATLAGRIEVSSLHKETTENFTELMGRL
jgi:ribonucleoside-diphosphate reductase alpha chain